MLAREQHLRRGGLSSRWRRAPSSSSSNGGGGGWDWMMDVTHQTEQIIFKNNFVGPKNLVQDI